MKIQTLFARPLVFIVMMVIVVRPVVAASTIDQLKLIIQKNGMPPWQKAVEQAKAMRENPSDMYAEGIWKSLDSEAPGKAFSRVTNPKDGRDLYIFSLWLRWKILTQNADGRYAYAYAANLSYMLDKNGLPIYQKDAAVFFFHGRLSLMIDGMRCVDRASPESVVIAYEAQPYMRPVVEYIAKMASRERAIAMLEAVTLEELRGERPPLKDLCTQGALAAQKALSAGRIPIEKKKGDDSQGMLGTEYHIDTSGIQPDLVSEEEWKLRRRQVLDNAIRDSAQAL